MVAERLRDMLWPTSARERWLLGAILLAALVLRLQVWRWHRLYPLGGDEREYFEQALRWLRGEGYHDLPLMRPPLYAVFLAGVFQFFDSQVQRVRLVQALISTGTVYLQWLLARLAFAPGACSGLTALVAAALAGGSYTLAANATELLTETTFLFGFSLALCLLLAARIRGWGPRAGGQWPEDAALGSWPPPGRRAGWFAVAAGVCTGLLALLRSVALPLLPLGGLWLLVPNPPTPFPTREGGEKLPSPYRGGVGGEVRRVLLALVFVLAGVVVIAPWTARNYLRYGRPIIVDTTGAENLWLDNAPVDREVVKQALYAMGEDRAARQALSLERGVDALLDDPARFARKVGREALELVALEYFDDMRARPAIWAPPLEVWLRVLLGDGLWLVLATVGSAGLWLLRDRRLQWLFVPWALYIVATSLLFHVELRYRLPLYPVLGLAAAALLAAARPNLQVTPVRWAGGVATAGLILVLMLSHRPYLREGAMLAEKHGRLWRGDGAGALARDPRSALARVAMAREEIRRCRAEDAACPEAERLLRAAIQEKRAHPYAHLLLGGLLRRQGAEDAARAEFAYETASLEDLQRWMVHTFGPRGVERLDIGDGLDLGDIVGFHPAGDGYRWSTARATAWLRAPEGPASVRLRLAGGAGGSQAPVPVRVSAAGMELARLEVGPDWQIYEVGLPAGVAQGSASTPGSGLAPITIEARSLRPRELDPASDDNRPLGIKVDWIEIVDE